MKISILKISHRQASWQNIEPYMETLFKMKILVGYELGGRNHTQDKLRKTYMDINRDGPFVC